MEVLTKKADCLRLVKPSKRYLIEVNGQKAVDAARAFIGPRCYRQLQIGGAFAAQIEVVVDDAGEYNGYANKWVAVSFVPAVFVPAVFTWLENNGFSGCLATFETETEDGPKEFERLFTVGDFTPDAAADYDEELTNIYGEHAHIYYLEDDSCLGYSFPDADGVTVYRSCDDANMAWEKRGAFPILVTFRDGRRVRYTSAILPLLETDPAVYEIMHAETGEILFYD